MTKTLKFYLGVILFSLAISLPLLIPYLHHGYFPSHDGEWAVVRLGDMFREVRDFQFPPRYSGSLNFGYGYPLFNFAYPFPYYLGLIFHLGGLGFVNSIKLVFALSIPISAIFMFLASRNIWKNNYAGIVSSVLYLYFPYRVLDLFVRGSIGESVAFAIFPIILFCLSKAIDNPTKWIYSVIAGFSFAALVLSHNIMAVLFSLTLLIYLVGSFLQKGKSVINPFLIMGILGFGLSAFFFIPALLEKHNILLSIVPIENRDLFFVSLKQFLFSPWGYGIPTDKTGGFTYQLGWQLLGVLLTASGVFIYQIYKKSKLDPDRILALTFFLGTIIMSVLLFSVSRPIWKIPLLSEINFPWTVLSQLGLIISLLAGYLMKFKYSKYIVFTLCILGLLIYIPLAKPTSYNNYDDNYYLTNQATTTSSNELMPLWVKSFPNAQTSQKIQVISGNAKINNVSFNSKKIIFNESSNTQSIIRVNTIYYPGWVAQVNGREAQMTYNNKYGVMDLKLPAGQESVLLNFRETNLRLISDLISIISLIAAGILGLFYLKQYVKH